MASFNDCAPIDRSTRLASRLSPLQRAYLMGFRRADILARRDVNAFADQFEALNDEDHAELRGVRREMARLRAIDHALDDRRDDTLRQGEGAKGSQPLAFSTDLKSAALIAPPMPSLMSRITGKLRTWRRRVLISAHCSDDEKELARMSQAALRDGRRALSNINLTAWPMAVGEASLAALSVLGLLAYLALLSHGGLSLPALGTVAAIGLGALISGVAGFAFSAISGAMLFQFRSDTIGVVETLLICSIANQAMCVWLLRREIVLRSLMPFVAGGLIGVPVGVWLLLRLEVGAFRTVLGALLVAYGLYMLFRPPIRLERTSLLSDMVSGFFGGTVGGFAAIPGAPVSIWCAAKGWNKTRQRAVFQPYILIMQFAALAALALMHTRAATAPGVPPLAWMAVPAGLVGTWWGMALFRKMRDQHFAKAVNLMLIASGVGLVA
jgi:uncharacterized protein